MRLIYFLSAFLFFITPCFAQFAKIIDKDGYVNLRSSANVKSKIIGQIKSSEIVFISDDENENWSQIRYEYKKGNVFSEEQSGYIHNSKLKKIDSFLQIPSIEDDEKSVNFICCEVEVEIKSTKFDYEKNKKHFKKFDGYYSYKNKYAFGALGRFPPETTYQSIKGYIEKNHFEIPPKEIENLFDINHNLSECYYDKETKMLYIILNNSDGSETYNVLLMIKDGKYLGNKIYQIH